MQHGRAHPQLFHPLCTILLYNLKELLNEVVTYMARPLRIGVDIGGTKIKAGLVDASGRILRSVKEPSQTAKGKAAMLRTLEKVVAGLWTPDVRGIRGIGVGLAGIVDHERGIYLQGPNFPASFRNIPVAALLQRKFRVPTRVDNDVHCFTLGEAKFGLGKGFSQVIGLTLGTGIGGGMVLNGKLYRGKNNAAGEFGHMTIAFDSKVLCSCGQAGHFEAFASGSGLRRSYKASTGKDLDAMGIERAANAGDAAAKRILAAMADALAAGLANIVHALDPDIIVVGGGLSAADNIWKPMLAALRRAIIFPELRKTPVVRSKGRDDANVLGAAFLDSD